MKDRTNAVDTRLKEMLRRVSASTLKPNQLLKEARNVPAAVAVAFATQRPEMIRLAAPQPLSEEQCKDLYDFIATLIETNHALQQHAHQVSVLVTTWMQALKGMNGAALRIEHFANFRHDDGDEEEV